MDTEEYRRVIEQLQTKGLISSQVSRSAAGSAARRRGIGPREVPRFTIRTPDIVQKDQREIVDTLLSTGPLSQVGATEIEGIFGSIGEHNIYRSQSKIRQLLRWLELIDRGGFPTERLKDLWGAAYVSPRKADRSRPTDPVESTPSVSPARDIYVGNLYYGATEEEVRSEFEKVGTVESVAVPQDYFTGNNRGYAFVRMSDSDNTMRAFAEVNGRSLGGRPLRLGWSFRRPNTN